MYKSYPRIVGETGGKDFIIGHSSADPKVLATAILRGAISRKYSFLFGFTECKENQCIQ